MNSLELFRPLEAVDLYCERLAPHLWAEPMNLVSNASFLVAAVYLVRFAKTRGFWHELHLRYLIWLIFVVGMGSALFHGLANRWSQAADVTPIGIFVLSYAFMLFRFAYGLSLLKSITCLFIAVGLTALTSLIDPLLLNGSQMYLGPTIMLLGLSVFKPAFLKAKVKLFHKYLGAATVLFLGSLTFRSLDLYLCPSWPWGTHFVWHILNGIVLALLMIHYIDSWGERLKEPH